MTEEPTTRYTTRYTIESTAWSTVGICECGWRVVTLDPIEALQAGRWHEQRAHPGSTSILRRLINASQRKTD